VATTLAENPRNRVKNADLCQKPGRKIEACSKIGVWFFLLNRKSGRWDPEAISTRSFGHSKKG
jgi:hypothetical protein